MIKKEYTNLIAAFLIGVLLAMMIGSNSGNGRYVPYQEGTKNRILDTKTGRVYSMSSKGTWIVAAEKVGVDKR